MIITNAAGQAKVAILIKSLASKSPAEYTTELAGVPITNQNAMDVEMASATPTIIGLVPELTAKFRLSLVKSYGKIILMILKIGLLKPEMVHGVGGMASYNIIKKKILTL